MNNKEILLKKLKDTLEIDPEKLKKVEELKSKADELNNNIDFYKATIKGCDALISTIELMKKSDSLSSTNLTGILTATILMFEEKGLIKIIRKKDK